MRAALSALLSALAEGAGGDAGRVLAETVDSPERWEALRAWGDRVAELLAGDPQAAGAVAAAMERHAPGSTAVWYGGDHADFRGGVFLREVVGVQVVIQHGAAALEALASLPPRPGGFTGREDETAELLRALDDSAAVLVTAVSGLGGVGKTALAVESTYLAREKGCFPGGVLFVDLHGYDDHPVTADQALQSLLRALGVPPEHIPATADDCTVLYRSVLAERAGQRGALLLLADNASSPDQVRPLLPGDGRHRVLVTSRDRLPQLGARLVPLDQLMPEAARQLLDHALRIADPDDSRVADDAEAAGQLAALCGNLPLALQIAAALLAEDPGMPVTELVDALAQSHDLLLHLDDGERSVGAAFELSYRRLPSEQARLLRLLALAPGPEVSDEVAAALVGTDAPPSRELKSLARAHLVERGRGRGWWRLHDLVRAFGAGVVTRDTELREEGEAARERVLRFYRRTADAADDRLRWLPGMAVPDRFADRAQALGWLDGERAGLVAAVLWGREERFAGAAADLALGLRTYLSWRRYFDDSITVGRIAQEVAHRLGDRRREATAWNNLGLALRHAGRAGEAVDAHVCARDLHRATGNRHREATAWNNLGIALRHAGRVGEAVEAHTRARDLYQAAGDRRRGAMAVNNLGIALRDAGRIDEAVQTHDKAFAVYREFEDWYGAGSALHNLACAYEAADRPAEARAHYLRSVDAFTRGNAPAEAARDSARAAALTAPAPTDKPAPASPPARTTDSVPPGPPPPDAPDTAGP